MMPFRFGDESSLPADLQFYFPLIEACPHMREEVGKIGYLTVHESYVDEKTAPRREGLLIESSGSFIDDPTYFTAALEDCFWGQGVFWSLARYEGGMCQYTSQVWDTLVDNKIHGIVDEHGGCEHLRGIIGPGTKLQAEELIWMTDCTPHEALPQEDPGFRQFFRVITPYISHWYADDSTPNPNVSLPESVKVVHGSKFEHVADDEMKAAKLPQ
jgi:hypothetical protein